MPIRETKAKCAECGEWTLTKALCICKKCGKKYCDSCLEDHDCFIEEELN